MKELLHEANKLHAAVFVSMLDISLCAPFHRLHRLTPPYRTEQARQS